MISSFYKRNPAKVAPNDRGEVGIPGSADYEAGKLFKVDGLFLEETLGL